MSVLDRLDRFTPHTFAALRIVSGVLFATHGAQKLFGVLGGQVASLTTQMGVGGVIELCTGLLIAVGVLTRPAAFLASGTMAVAYLQFHWRGQFGSAFWPVVNKGELALIYSFLFLYVACRGPGSATLGKATSNAGQPER
jgi:putative oxidoreductase